MQKDQKMERETETKGMEGGMHIQQRRRLRNKEITEERDQSVPMGTSRRDQGGTQTVNIKSSE